MVAHHAALLICFLLANVRQGGRVTLRMAANDFYDRLGVARTADAREIKRAYRRKALEFHPDVNSAPEAREQFVKINEAYETLSDPDKRRAYDMPGASAGRRPGAGAGRRPPPRRWSRPGAGAGADPKRAQRTEEWRQENPTADMIDDSFSSIFSDLFRSTAERGARGGFEAVLTDVVEFLESGVGEMADPTPSEFADFLRTGSMEELRKERDSSEALVKQLEEKVRRMRTDLEMAKGEAKVHRERTGGAVSRTLDELEREAELEERAAGLQKRLETMESFLRRERRKEQQLRSRIADGPASGVPPRSSYGAPAAERPAGAPRGGSRPPPRTSLRDPTPDQVKGIDDELERLKRDMGL